MRLAIFLLSTFILNMAYANDEPTSLDSRERGYIQGSLEKFWKENFHTSLKNSENAEVNYEAATEAYFYNNDNINQGLYISGSINPILYAPNPNFAIVFDDIKMSGAVPYNTKFLQSTEVGLGYKFKNVRVEGDVKWIRFHLGTPQVHTAEIASLPTYGENGESYADQIQFTIDEDAQADNIGFLGKLYYDWDLTDFDFDGAFIYVGSGFGVVRSGATEATEAADWTSIFNIDLGTILELTDSTHFKVGYEYMRFGATDYGAITLDPYDRHAAVVGIHVYKRR